LWPLICVFRPVVSCPDPPERTTREGSLSLGKLTQTRTTMSGCDRGGQEETSAKINNSAQLRRPQIAHASADPRSRVATQSEPPRASRQGKTRRFAQLNSGPFRPGLWLAGWPGRAGRRPGPGPGTAWCG
jgi:hypothetical protein